MATTAQAALWVPALVFGNLFAAFWLVRMLMVAYSAAFSWLWPKRRADKGQSDRATSARPASPIVPNGAVSSLQLCKSSADTPAECSGKGVTDGQPTCQSSPAPSSDEEEEPQPEAIRRASHSLVEPVYLEWRDIGCTYRGPRGPHTVLSGVTGTARPGSLHALLGPSGAGKSSLLDILAQRKQVGELTGQVLLNGRKASRKALVCRSAYVPQDDNFMPIMTAAETLRFYASLLLPPCINQSTRAVRAEQVLSVLGLSHCHDTLVGGQLPGGLTLRGLSGGERKRLALGVGLLAAPSLLFLDEPTSGLDSFAALTVMRYIRAMATEAHHVVIASIHQPRSAIWNMFDEVTVLSHGLMMYSGPCADMVHWFTHTLPKTIQDLNTPHPHNDNNDNITTTDTIDGSVTTMLNEQMVGCLHGVTSAMRKAMHSGRRSSHVSAGRVSGSGSGGEEYVIDMAGGVAGGACEPLPVITYHPEAHGVPSDWVLDLLSVSFGGGTGGEGGDKMAYSGGHASNMPCHDKKGPHPGQMVALQSEAQLHTAATAFAHYQSKHLVVTATGTSPRVASPHLPHSPTPHGGHGCAAETRDMRGTCGAEHTTQGGLRIVTEATGVSKGTVWAQQQSPASDNDVAVVARCRTLSLHTTTTTNPTTDPTTHTHRRRAHTMLHPDSHTTLAPTCQEDKSHEAHLATQLEALCGVGHAGAVAAAPARAATLPYAHTPMARMVAMVACEPAGVTSVSTIAHGCTDEDGVSTVSSSGGGTSQGCASPAKPVCVYPAVVQPRTSDSTAILVDTPTTVNMTSPQAYVKLLGSLQMSAMRQALRRACVHLRALLWREVMSITRNPADVAGRMMTFAWLAVFAGLVFYGVPNTLDGVQLRLNVMFSNTAFVLLMPYTSMSLYTADRRYYLADSSSRLYSPSLYYVAKVLATLPFHVICSVVYTLIIVGMAGLRHGLVPVVQIIVIISLTSLIAVQVLHAASTVARNQDIAFMIALLWTAVNLLMSGFFIAYNQFAFPWLSQLRYLSAQSYAFEGLARIELEGMVYDCSQGMGTREINALASFLPQQLSKGPQATVVASFLRNPGADCRAHANAILNYLNLTRPFSITLAILIGYLAVMHVLTYVALKVASRQEKR